MSGDAPLPEHEHSVTRLIQRLQANDPHAASQLWRRYFERLLPLARARLAALPHRAVDEEDVLLSVFDRFFQAAKQDRFVRLADRDDLWQILLMLTERKVADHFRAAQTQKRGGNMAPTADSAQLARAQASPEPGPEFVAAFNDSLACALGRLMDASTREVALLRMEGYENREIAERLRISLSSVERKLRVIREVWQETFGG